MPFKSPSVPTGTSERDLAAQASRDCPDCGGAGIVPIYHPRFAGESIGTTQDGRRYSASGAAHCMCPLGVWIREKTPPEVQARIPRVEDILDGQSHWLLANPRGVISSLPSGRCAQEDFDAFWRKVEAGHMLKHPNEGVPPKATVWSIETDLRRRLVQKLGLDERMADVLTIDELRMIEAQGDLEPPEYIPGQGDC